MMGGIISLNWLIEKLNNDEKLGYISKRIVYIVCFVCLCFVDQVIGSATGSVQYGLKHYTGVVIAIIILTAYRPSDFLKVPILFWIISFFGVRQYILAHVSMYSGNYMRMNTFLWNVGIYGVIYIRLFYRWFVEKKLPRMNWLLFLFWILMVSGMVMIRSDFSWTYAMIITYLCFYVTEYDEKSLNNMYSGMIEGIIIGFFIIQGQAWLYRPYDTVRYHGMYSHPNMNGLLYVCTYFATLAKWYMMKLKKRGTLPQLLIILLAGLIISTSFFTGSRTAFLTMLAITIIFLIFQGLSCNRKKLREVIIAGMKLVLVVLVLFYPAYALIRYMPAYVDNPKYFENDIVEEKIQTGESIYSEKYIEIDEALEEMFGRYFWFHDEESVGKKAEWWRRILNCITFTLNVEAAEVVEETQEVHEEYIEPGTDSKHTLNSILGEDVGFYNVRIDIYKYFLNKLTLIGKKGNTQGVWIHSKYQATHCHNIFLQIAYDFGIVIGIMFIIVVLFPFIRVIKGIFQKRAGVWYYRLFITLGWSTILVVFGMFEIDWIYGQLPFTMFWLVQYIVYHRPLLETRKND